MKSQKDNLDKPSRREWDAQKKNQSVETNSEKTERIERAEKKFLSSS